MFGVRSSTVVNHGQETPHKLNHFLLIPCDFNINGVLKEDFNIDWNGVWWGGL